MVEHATENRGVGGSIPSLATRILLRERSRLVAVAVATALAGCAGPPEAAPPPDIVLVSLDTLRADLLEMEREGGGPELPNLAAFAAGSVRFDRAFSPVPFTLPAHLTLLTGVHPLVHGVDERGQVLPRALPTLAERLGEAGYRSVGVACGPWLRARYGFGRGFDGYRQLAMTRFFAPLVRRDVERLAGKAFAGDTAGPRFLFAHFYDAHSDFGKGGNRLPYDSPDAYRADLEIPEDVVCDEAGRCATRRLQALHDTGRAPPELMRRNFELYRRGARFLDDQLALFFDELRALGLWERSVIVVTADHGEEFGEHGGVLHQQVYGETTRVPMLVRLPGGRDGGRRIDRLVTLADVAPTLLRLAGVPVPAGLDGRDLFEPTGATELLQQDVRESWGYGLRRGRWLLVGPRLHVPHFRLYDTLTDPGEREIRLDRPAVASELEARLKGRLRELRRARAERAGSGAAETFDTDEDVEDLRSLGYL